MSFAQGSSSVVRSIAATTFISIPKAKKLLSSSWSTPVTPATDR
jgi:hypothetical protein